MSFVLSTVAGGLVAGGFYYSLSNLILTRTEQHQKDLTVISQRLIEPPPPAALTPPASARIARHDFSMLLKDKWNGSVAVMFYLAREECKRADAWSRRLLYGDAGSKGGPDN
ncbi:hypothetical protein K488DRAFT_88873 [Vararia minispora EC-137]|uniref:Uncharacterized protein n=1 Tax=Vararia minispora EC-137 TaxID=1314806 RepID=A0ACB8QCB8_9AGAM|nr:hypothetical protein K488DRAFT_88873 [Vararia minispora EC-137]